MPITAAPRMDFCRRCGDPVGASQASSSSCKRCGGAGVEARVRSSEPPSSKQRADPWASRYVSGSLASSSPPPSPGRAPTLRPASVSFPTSRTAPLSLGVPSSISRDLRAPVTPRTQGARTLSDASAPILKAPDGGLSKVVGSLVEPTSSRAQWACAGCESQFARDATLFIAPGTSNTFYCRDCYAARHALGVCPGCARRVLGLEKEEGKFVRAGEDVWHGKCWACPCGVTKDVLRGMDGMPVCDDCFDKPRARRPVPGAAQPAPTNAPSQASMSLAQKRGSTSAAALRGLSGASSRNTALGPSIDALTKRFASSSVSGATTIPSPAPSPLLAPQRTGSPTRAPPPAWGAPPSPRRVTSTFPAPRSRCNSGTTSPILGILPSRSSGSVRGASLSRNGSLSGSPPKAPRPLTAQFTGDAFNLAAFQSAQGGGGGLMRHDSRSRSVSPSKRESVGSEAPRSTRTTSGFPIPSNASLRSGEPSPAPSTRGRSPARSEEPDPAEAVRCAICSKSPWDGVASGAEEVNMLVIRGSHVHPHCFKCHVCALPIEGTKSFVRVEDEAGEEEVEGKLGRFAHPACAPPATVTRKAAPTPAATAPAQHRNLSHATHQPAPRPSLDPAPAPRAPVHAFLTSSSAASASARPGSVAMSASSSAQSSSSATSARRFQPTNGAAPPTRSTLDVRPSMAANNKAAGIFASSTNTATPAGTLGGTSPVLGSTGRKLGGLNPCAGCGLKLSPLESVPGPRGTSWHKTCLRCGGVKPAAAGSYGAAALPRKCGKQLDSAAKVDEAGQVRCSACASARRG